MRGSLIVVACFVAGCLLGASGCTPNCLLDGHLSTYVLYLLMIQVGLSLGSDSQLKAIIRGIRPKLLLVPLATISGTMLFAAVISLFLSRWSLTETMAVGCGFGYYSLSSILITQLKEPSIGLQAASELGTIALIANVLREIFTLLGTPLFKRYFGVLAPICAGGATTMDTTLPIITECCGKEWVFVSILHAILLDFSVPLLVSFFCA